MRPIAITLAFFSFWTLACTGGDEAAAPEPEEATEEAAAEDEAAPAKPQTVVREAPKVGRNDPCPCGSGKKYKQCHGALS